MLTSETPVVNNNEVRPRKHQIKTTGGAAQWLDTLDALTSVTIITLTLKTKTNWNSQSCKTELK